jgi:hypothetical protein
MISKLPKFIQKNLAKKAMGRIENADKEWNTAASQIPGGLKAASGKYESAADQGQDENTVMRRIIKNRKENPLSKEAETLPSSYTPEQYPESFETKKGEMGSALDKTVGPTRKEKAALMRIYNQKEFEAGRFGDMDKADSRHKQLTTRNDSMSARKQYETRLDAESARNKYEGQQAENANKQNKRKEELETSFNTQSGFKGDASFMQAIGQAPTFTSKENNPEDNPNFVGPKNQSTEKNPILYKEPEVKKSLKTRYEENKGGYARALKYGKKDASGNLIDEQTGLVYKKLKDSIKQKTPAINFMPKKDYAPGINAPGSVPIWQSEVKGIPNTKTVKDTFKYTPVHISEKFQDGTKKVTGYNKLDIKLGGILPGGVTRSEAKYKKENDKLIQEGRKIDLEKSFNSPSAPASSAVVTAPSFMQQAPVSKTQSTKKNMITYKEPEAQTKKPTKQDYINAASKMTSAQKREFHRLDAAGKPFKFGDLDYAGLQSKGGSKKGKVAKTPVKKDNGAAQHTVNDAGKNMVNPSSNDAEEENVGQYAKQYANSKLSAGFSFNNPLEAIARPLIRMGVGASSKGLYGVGAGLIGELANVVEDYSTGDLNKYARRAKIAADIASGGIKVGQTAFTQVGREGVKKALQSMKPTDALKYIKNLWKNKVQKNVTSTVKAAAKPAETSGKFGRAKGFKQNPLQNSNK